MITGILLAAGNASRFGSNKLLHLLPDGTPIAMAAARNLKAAIPSSLAIVRPQDHALVDLFSAEGFTVVVSASTVEGMGVSLACGVRASSHAKGWIIALADMPFIQPDTILAIRDALEHGYPLAVPVYHGQRGHPVGFGNKFFGELTNLTGDQGARSIVSAHAADGFMVACEDPGILADIDSEADMERHRELMRV
jgi:molybdenum cofactor cytidylyltransferase